jgi:hypothetical protein
MNRIEDWALQIQKHEGYYPGSASYRNNNPGNFRCTSLVMGEFGATKCVNNLAVFPTYEMGFNALKTFLTYACTDQLRSYRSSMTLLDFYKVYAPSSDNNNPLNYATQVANGLGVNINTTIGELYEVINVPKQMLIFNQQKTLGFLGKTKFTIARWGCLDTVMTEIYDYLYGDKMTPDVMAQKLVFNENGDLVWSSLSNVDLKLISRVRYYNKAGIDKALKDPDQYIALQVNNNHWVWVIGRYLPFLGYKIADSWLGDKSYTNRYKNNITGYALIGKK